jgi:hypothetical protein
MRESTEAVLVDEAVKAKGEEFVHYRKQVLPLRRFPPDPCE